MMYPWGINKVPLKATRMVTLYWPQRRLYGAIQKATRAGDSATKILYPVGFRVTQEAVCIVDFTSDRDSVRDDLTIVGTCVQKDLANGNPTHSAASAEVVVEFESTASSAADSLDKSLHIRSSGTRPDASSVIVLYDPRLFAHGPKSCGFEAVNTVSPLCTPLQKLSAHFEAENRSSNYCGPNAFARACEAATFYIIGYPFAVASVVWRGSIQSILTARVLDWLPVGRGATLKDYSQSAHMLSCRGSVILGMPDRVRARYRSYHKGGSYTEIFDFIVYLMADYALGCAFASFLTSMVVSMAAEMQPSPTAFLDLLRENVIWLMGAPAGFKVNVRLAAILGNGILMWLDFWEFLLRSMISSSVWEMLVTSPTARNIVSRIWHHAGLTIQLSAVSDMLWFMTWNSYWVFLYFTKLNAMQLRLLSSLWRLFLGKKNNVLRNRVDSCEYDVNQLLLGTLLFTILVFLVTTNAVFFVFFGIVRFGVWFASVSLWLPIVLLRGLPLVSILHRLIKPSQYTDSLTIETLADKLVGESLCVTDVSPGRTRERDAHDQDALRNFMQQQTHSESQKTLFFRVVAQPIGLGHLFSRLTAYQNQVVRSYNASAIVNSCLFGAEIVPVDASVLFDTPMDLTEPLTKQKME